MYSTAEASHTAETSSLKKNDPSGTPMKTLLPLSQPARAFAAMCALLSVSTWNVPAQAAIAPAQAPGDSQIYAIVHIDVEPKDMNAAIPLLTAYAQQAARDPGVQHIEILQQDVGMNHFTLVEHFRSEAAYDAFVSERYVKQMRDRIQPMLGSPFDERLHSALIVR